MNLRLLGKWVLVSVLGKVGTTTNNNERISRAPFHVKHVQLC